MAEGDWWVDTDDSNKLYVYSGAAWIAASSVDALQALADAAQAQATADGQLVGFYQDTAPASGMYYGDIWIDTNGADPLDTTCIYRYQDATGGYTAGSMSWVNAPTNAVGKVYLDAASAQSAADGKIVTFYQTGVPSGANEGDLWVDTDNDYKVWRWSGSAWQAVTGAVAHLNILTDAYIQSLSFDKITAATNTASLTIGSGGSLKGGATGYNAGTGFWMGYSSGYKFFIGNAAGNKMLWTGSALEVTGKIIMGTGSTLDASYVNAGTFNAARIAANSITVNKLNIDGNVQFKPGATYHAIMGCNGIYYDSGLGERKGFITLSATQATIHSGATAGNDLNVIAAEQLLIQSTGGDITINALDDIRLDFNSTNYCIITSAATTGGQWGLGYINMTLNGVARSIAIENAH